MPSIVFWIGVGGGTAQYRCYTPGAALARAGWDVSFANDAGAAVDADVVVLQRVLHPGTADAIRTLQRHGRTVVYDIDDWYDGIPAYNPAATKVDGERLGWLHEAMAAADIITCSTPELAEGYGHLGRTVVLPNYLDPDLWSGNDHYRTPHAAVHVGWLGDFAARSADLELLKPWVGALLDRRPEVRFVACGCPELLDWLGVAGLASPEWKLGGIMPYAHLPAMLAWLDVGLVPLAANRFNNAKSWCKGMEYNAMGVPAVASPAREYRSFIQPGINGYLVRRNEWVSAVERTIDNLPALRKSARWSAGRYLIDDHIGDWIDAYSLARVPA